MINYLANYLPWRQFPLLGTWEVDMTATEERLNKQLPDKSKVQSTLSAIAKDQWEFTRTHSRRKAIDFGEPDPDVESKRRYWWASDGDDGLYVSEAREDGQEMMFKVDLIEGGRFEFFEPLRGYAIVWKRS